MKHIIAISLMVLLVGCEKHTSEWRPTHPHPIPEMDGCVYQSIFTGEKTLHVVRCPSQTVSMTYSCGKNCNTATLAVEQMPSNLTCERNDDDTYTCTP